MLIIYENVLSIKFINLSNYRIMYVATNDRVAVFVFTYNSKVKYMGYSKTFLFR